MGPLLRRSRVGTLLPGLTLCLAALLALARSAAADGFCPPGGVVTITTPSNGAQNLSGIIHVEFTTSSISPNYSWGENRVRVFRVNDNGTEIQIDELLPSQSSPGHYWADWNSNTQPNGRYRFYAFAVYGPADPNANQCWTPATNFTLGNPSPTRAASADDLNCPCRCDQVSTGSSTSPLEGHQSFTIPITSWEFRGQRFGFSITYNSHAIRDPQGLESPELAGLSERNSHWSHTYAQWIDLYRDQTGKQYAVWHHEGGTTAFPYNAVTGQYDSPESNLTMTASGPSQFSPDYPCDGMMKSLKTLHTSFVIQVADGTQYKFNFNPYSGEPHLVWRTAECSAIPFYLLSRIRTRLGRELMLTWSTGAEPRVTHVRDETGAVRLTLTNTGAFPFLTTVVDSLGRTHTFVPAAVPDENGTNRQKLASVTIQGPGSPRTTRTWSFSYRDPANPDQAYGGTGGYTGDLLIAKQAPNGP
jgi:hypothetical protein